MAVAYVFDFDGTLISEDGKNEKLPLFDKIKKLSQTNTVFILTGRDQSDQSHLEKFLKKEGVKIEKRRIICVGHNIDIPARKSAALKALRVFYDTIEFWDNAHDNITAANKIDGVRSHLVSPSTADTIFDVLHTKLK